MWKIEKGGRGVIVFNATLSTIFQLYRGGQMYCRSDGPSNNEWLLLNTMEQFKAGVSAI